MKSLKLKSFAQLITLNLKHDVQSMSGDEYDKAEATVLVSSALNRSSSTNDLKKGETSLESRISSLNKQLINNSSPL